MHLYPKCIQKELLTLKFHAFNNSKYLSNSHIDKAISILKFTVNPIKHQSEPKAIITMDIMGNSLIQRIFTHTHPKPYQYLVGIYLSHTTEHPMNTNQLYKIAIHKHITCGTVFETSNFIRETTQQWIPAEQNIQYNVRELLHTRALFNVTLCIPFYTVSLKSAIHLQVYSYYPEAYQPSI